MPNGESYVASRHIATSSCEPSGSYAPPRENFRFPDPFRLFDSRICPSIYNNEDASVGALVVITMGGMRESNPRRELHKL